MSCHICNVKISEMNDLEKLLSKEEDESTFQFNLPVLHSYIHFFDCLLHISYRLEFKKWRVSCL